MEVRANVVQQGHKQAGSQGERRGCWVHRHISYAEVGFWVRRHRPRPQQPRTFVASWVSSWEPSVRCQAIPLQRALLFQLASWNHPWNHLN